MNSCRILSAACRAREGASQKSEPEGSGGKAWLFTLMRSLSAASSRFLRADTRGPLLMADNLASS